jgi:hypothetical protein
MSDHKKMIYHGKFIAHTDGSISPLAASDNERFKLFKENLQPDQTIEVFMDSDLDNGTVAQLAKIHACIRELAKDTGYSFEDMKLEVKRQAGLCVKKNLGGEVFMVCKSFADCSKDELALAIEAILQIGDTVGINFR